MECDVILDLIPLYADGCCSEASHRMVEAHVNSCPGCRSCLEAARVPMEVVETVQPPRMGRVSQWRASMLQSALFFVYFAILTVGVAREAATPAGLLNGWWGASVVVPATGFLLSLSNWYFLRLYRSRRSFTVASVASTAAATILCFAWAMRHYGALPFWIPGAVFAAGDLVLSGLLAWRYAGLLGKE